jgi:hypothetical protein
LRLVANKATEQLVSLLGLCNSEVFLGLEGFLEFIELLFLYFFLGRGLFVREFEKRGLISFLTATKC